MNKKERANLVKQRQAVKAQKVTGLQYSQWQNRVREYMTSKEILESYSKR